MHRIALVFILLVGCDFQNPKERVENRVHITNGKWRFTMDINGDLLPFNAVLDGARGRNPRLTITNGEEKIEVDALELRNDSLIADLPVFNTRLLFRVESPFMLSGVYTDMNRDAYRIPVTGEHAADFRFTNSASSQNIPSRYKATFTRDDSTTIPAVLLLNNEEGRLTGTFLTETGDYRHLEGNIMNGSVYLSSFDGTHAYYFRAKIRNDSLVDGIFKSGIHLQRRWNAVPDSTFSLRDPNRITSLTEGSKFDFNLPNQDGDTVSLSDLGLTGKVVVVDMMGTWCPNCMDAAKSLSSLAKEHPDVAIVPILFEKQDDLDHAKKVYEKFSRDIEMPEDFLFGGLASKSQASRKFPMLSSIHAFPTLIFIDKSGKVVRIHTGFYGPATGKKHQEFIKSTDSLLSYLSSQES